MKYFLTEDIKSTFRKGYIYGKKGEEVTEVSRSGHVLIVEGKTGRFPVTIEKVTEIN